MTMLFCATLSACMCNENYISITTKDSEDVYQFLAKYHKTKTQAVQLYINSCLLSDTIYKSQDEHLDKTIILVDKTEFYIMALPGKLIIKMDKNKNESESLARIRKMCKGIAKLVKT